MLKRIHHAAIICSDYPVSKRFYTECLGLRVLAENFRPERQSYKLDLALPDGGQIELFSMPGAPPRPSYPEAQGLRHLAFEVEDIEACRAALQAQGIAVEAQTQGGGDHAARLGPRARRRNGADSPITRSSADRFP